MIDVFRRLHFLYEKPYKYVNHYLSAMYLLSRLWFCGIHVHIDAFKVKLDIISHLIIYILKLAFATSPTIHAAFYNKNQNKRFC